MGVNVIRGGGRREEGEVGMRSMVVYDVMAGEGCMRVSARIVFIFAFPASRRLV